MKLKLFFPVMFAAACVLAIAPGCGREETKPAPGSKLPPAANAPDPLPFKLDLHGFYTGSFHPDRPQEWLYEDFHGETVVDSLPFAVNGYAEAYGERNLRSHQGQQVKRDLVGILVGRKFDELHLIHEARFREYAGCTLATLRLNYDDHSHADLPVQYGVHVFDVSRLLPEETEEISDPDTKLVWRGKKTTEWEVTRRLTKSRLLNPHPEKTVLTMDVINARTRASYVIAAATVARADAKREITPGLPLNAPPRRYDGTLKVHVADAATGKPLAGADCDPAMNIDKSYVVGDPVLTDANGDAIFKYPTARTHDVSVAVRKDGYSVEYGQWHEGAVPATNVFRLQPAEQKQAADDATKK